MKWEIKNLGLIASCQASCLLSNFLLRNLASAGDMNHISKWLLHIKKYPRSQPNSAEGYPLYLDIISHQYTLIYMHRAQYYEYLILCPSNHLPRVVSILLRSSS